MIKEGVCLYNVPLYSTHHIMRWILEKAPLWQKPSLLSSPSKVMAVVSVQPPCPDTVQTYNQQLNKHGLKGHNLFMLSKCGMQITAVLLQLMTEPANLPMIVLCTLGKDRSGVVFMLALHIGQGQVWCSLHACPAHCRRVERGDLPRL